MHDRFGKIPLARRIPVVGGTYCAHTPSIRTFIVIECTLVIARGSEHSKTFAAHKSMHGAFAPSQIFFHDDSSASLAERSLFYHPADRLACFLPILRNDY